MMKIFALTLCFAAVYAAPTAEAEADAEAEAFYGLHGHYPAAYAGALTGALAAPIAAPLAVAPANCEHLTVDLATNVCTPSAETVCETKQVLSQEITTEPKCLTVVSTLCDAAPAAYGGLFRGKREAEADPEAFYAAHGYYPHGYAVAGAPALAAVAPALPAIAPIAVAASHQVTHTVISACHEVSTEHCVDNPIILEVVTPIEQCHVVSKVTCEVVINKLPKTVCTPVETVLVSAVAAPLAYGHLGAYAHTW